MLFNYRYVDHSIGRFQTYLEHLVKEVWCKPVGDFTLDLLLPELRLVVEAIFNDDSITKDHLDGPIRRIYKIFKDELTPDQRQQVSNWYDHNNDIAALCSSDPNRSPATYPDIRKLNADLEVELKDFCKSLFTDVLHLKAVKQQIGEIDSHYAAFVRENDSGKCPYCGYGDIKGTHHTRREAYDHYLPKGTYPFNSVNFRNLAPMCHECNSGYKLQKDPTANIDPLRRKAAGTRRRAFYSYATATSDITITVAIKTMDVINLEPSQIDLTFSAPGRNEEIEAWKDVFGIEERYKAKLCGKNDGKAWLARVLDERANVGLTKEQMLAYELKAADQSPFADANFLKKPFLLACKETGIIQIE